MTTDDFVQAYLHAAKSIARFVGSLFPLGIFFGIPIYLFLTAEPSDVEFTETTIETTAAMTMMFDLLPFMIMLVIITMFVLPVMHRV